MSAELQMSSAAPEADFPYRALSRAAIASVIFAVISAVGLIPALEAVLVLALLGIVAGLVGIRTIDRFPNEYSGKSLAMMGAIGSLLILVGGVSMHTYIYLTEVPEGYRRIPFHELQQPNENLPDGPTQLAAEIDGVKVFIKGYIHPSSGAGVLRQFILVPDLGTCCFGGQPRSSDMIEVNLRGGSTIKGGLTRRKLAGKFTLNKAPESINDFDNQIYYRLRADMAK